MMWDEIFFILAGRIIHPIWKWGKCSSQRPLFIVKGVFLRSASIEYTMNENWQCGSAWIQQVSNWLLELQPDMSPTCRNKVIKPFYLSQWSQWSLQWNQPCGIEADWCKWRLWLWHHLMTKQSERWGGGSDWLQLPWGDLKVTKRKALLCQDLNVLKNVFRGKQCFTLHYMDTIHKVQSVFTFNM